MKRKWTPNSPPVCIFRYSILKWGMPLGLFKKVGKYCVIGGLGQRPGQGPRGQSTLEARAFSQSELPRKQPIDTHGHYTYNTCTEKKREKKLERRKKSEFQQKSEKWHPCEILTKALGTITYCCHVWPSAAPQMTSCWMLNFSLCFDDSWLFILQFEIKKLVREMRESQLKKNAIKLNPEKTGLFRELKNWELGAIMAPPPLWLRKRHQILISACDCTKCKSIKAPNLHMFNIFTWTTRMQK